MTNIRLHNIDCMEFMKGVPDKFYELAIVDPPYGSNIMKKNKFQRHGTTDTSYRNESIPDPEYYLELYRISKRWIIWGCQYQIAHMNKEGSFIVWDKKADPDLHNMSSCDIAWYSKRDRIRTFDGHWCGAVKFETEPTIHIHQKPVGLYEWLLSNYASPGDKIFDSHGGSMSIAIACFNMGFELDLCEIDPIHFRRGEKRLNDHIAKYAPADQIPVNNDGQTKLF